MKKKCKHIWDWPRGCPFCAPEVSPKRERGDYWRGQMDMLEAAVKLEEDIRKDERASLIFILDQEIERIDLFKTKDEFTSNHLHGLKRAKYLLDQQNSH